METLFFSYSGGKPHNFAKSFALVGVLGSGNLEILLEPVALGGKTTIAVTTAVRGFGAIWQAVCDDFFAKHQLADVHITIQDAGATPAIVALRLDQAVEDIMPTKA